MFTVFLYFISVLTLSTVLIYNAKLSISFEEHLIDSVRKMLELTSWFLILF